MNAMDDSSGAGLTKLVKGCLSDSEIEQTASLLSLVWPNAGITADYLHWLYRENPAGTAEIYNVWDNGQIIAHYAAIPVKADLFGVQENGLLSLNTAVHPTYRGKGYFKKLALQTFADAHTRGTSFVIGVANANSTVLFRRQLRFQLVCPLTVKIGVGSIKRLSVLAEKGRDYTQSWDEQTLSWRLRRPCAKYRFVDQNGSTSILGDTGKYGIWTIMHELDSSMMTLSQESLFRWNPLTLWIGLDSSCDWDRSYYINLPDRFKASPLNFVFKDLSGLGRTLAPHKIKFSLLDFDAF